VWVVDGIRSSLGPIALSSAFGHGVALGFEGRSVYFAVMLEIVKFWEEPQDSGRFCVGQPYCEGRNNNKNKKAP
jgi:hypothetical protein